MINKYMENTKMITERKYDEAAVEVNTVNGVRVANNVEKNEDKQTIDAIWNRQVKII